MWWHSTCNVYDLLCFAEAGQRRISESCLSLADAIKDLNRTDVSQMADFRIWNQALDAVAEELFQRVCDEVLVPTLG
jgi:hypothetical protein